MPVGVVVPVPGRERELAGDDVGLGRPLSRVGDQRARASAASAVLLVVGGDRVGGEQERLEVGAAAVERARERLRRAGDVVLAEREPAALAIELPAHHAGRLVGEREQLGRAGVIADQRARPRGLEQQAARRVIAGVLEQLLERVATARRIAGRRSAAAPLSRRASRLPLRLASAYGVARAREVAEIAIDARELELGARGVGARRRR